MGRSAPLRSSKCLVSIPNFVRLTYPLQSLERCYVVDENLARLARSFPDTKFLRAKASALGFATTKSSSKSRKFGTPLKLLREEDEDDDEGFDEKDKYNDEDSDRFDSDDVDLDMLPTMLVYLNGDLVQSTTGYASIENQEKQASKSYSTSKPINQSSLP